MNEGGQLGRESGGQENAEEKKSQEKFFSFASPMGLINIEAVLD